MATTRPRAARRRFPPGPLLRAPEELEDPGVGREPALRVSTAEVVLANYELLQHDFPQLRHRSLRRHHPELREIPAHRRSAAYRRLIDRWLLRHAAIVSESQARQSVVNTPIETSGEPVEVCRPPRYGRSVVASVRSNNRSLTGELKARWGDEPDGLLDLKGAGVAAGVEPAVGSHSNGLLRLDEAFKDLVVQELVEAVFRHARTCFWTVPVYAVIDLNVDLLHYGHRTPVAIQVRRAHRRPRGGAELPPRGSCGQRVRFEIEMLLRHYGITSSNHSTQLAFELRDGRLEASYGERPVDGYWQKDQHFRDFLSSAGVDRPSRFDGVNVQLIRETGCDPSTAQLVDFGQYEVRRRFELPVLSLVADRVMRWGGAIGPDSPHFVQPDPVLRAPVERWAPTALSAFTWDLVTRFRAGTLTRRQLRNRLASHVATATGKWPEEPEA